MTEAESNTISLAPVVSNRQPSKKSETTWNKLTARCQASSSPVPVDGGHLASTAKSNEAMQRYGIEPGTPFLANQVFIRPTPFQRLSTFGTHALPLPVRLNLGLQLRCEFSCGFAAGDFAIAVAFSLCHSENSMPRRMLQLANSGQSCHLPRTTLHQHCWKYIQAPLVSLRLLSIQGLSNEAV